MGGQVGVSKEKDGMERVDDYCNIRNQETCIEKFSFETY